MGRLLSMPRKATGFWLYIFSATLFHLHLRFHHFVVYHICVWLITDTSPVCEICKGE